MLGDKNQTCATHHVSRITFHGTRNEQHKPLVTCHPSLVTLFMTLLNTIFILGAAFLAVFWQAAFNGVRHLLGAQIDLLPALMVYASLYGGFTNVVLLAVLGGLWFDSLSANPLGVSVLPLFVIGVAIYANRDLILRNQTL